MAGAAPPSLPHLAGDLRRPRRRRCEGVAACAPMGEHGWSGSLCRGAVDARLAAVGGGGDAPPRVRRGASYASSRGIRRGISAFGAFGWIDPSPLFEIARALRAMMRPRSLRRQLSSGSGARLRAEARCAWFRSGHHQGRQGNHTPMTRSEIRVDGCGRVWHAVSRGCWYGPECWW